MLTAKWSSKPIVKNINEKVEKTYPFKMERDPTTLQRSSYFSGCMMSPSCFPVQDEFQYSRIHCCINPNKRSRRWRNILRKFMREGKSLCGSKPLSFQYDPVSYSQNFDEGCHLEDPRRHSQVFHHDVSAAAPAHHHCSLIHPQKNESKVTSHKAYILWSVN